MSTHEQTASSSTGILKVSTNNLVYGNKLKVMNERRARTLSQMTLWMVDSYLYLYPFFFVGYAVIPNCHSYRDTNSTWRSSNLLLSYLFIFSRLFSFSSAIDARKDCHMSYFMMPLSVLGLALPWAMLSDTVGTHAAVWQVRYATDVHHAVLMCRCAVYRRVPRALSNLSNAAEVEYTRYADKPCTVEIRIYCETGRIDYIRYTAPCTAEYRLPFGYFSN